MDKKDLAKIDWTQGMKYAEIAEKYSVTVNTVKSWKVRYWKKENEKKCAEKCADSIKKSVQKVGAPLNNKNNYSHGIYEKLLFESLTPDEQKLFADTNIDETEELKRTIRFCDLQIVRFMKKIKEAEETAGGLILSGVTLVQAEGKDRQPISNTKSSYKIGVYELILKYNNEIEKAKAKKIRCLETLIKLSNDNERLELEKQKFELLKEKSEKENIKEDTQDISVQIYIPENNRKQVIIEE